MVVFEIKPVSMRLEYIQRDPGGLAQGFVDLDLGCSTILLGQYVATVAAHLPGELPKSKSQQNLVPDHQGHAVQGEASDM